MRENRAVGGLSTTVTSDGVSAAGNDSRTVVRGIARITEARRQYVARLYGNCRSTRSAAGERRAAGCSGRACSGSGRWSGHRWKRHRGSATAPCNRGGGACRTNRKRTRCIACQIGARRSVARSSPRCGAKARTTGKPCRSAAMSNGRCRMHGGKSTGPRTSQGLERVRKARTRHGMYFAETARLAHPPP